LAYLRPFFHYGETGPIALGPNSPATFKLADYRAAFAALAERLDVLAAERAIGRVEAIGGLAQRMKPSESRESRADDGCDGGYDRDGLGPARRGGGSPIELPPHDRLPEAVVGPSFNSPGGQLLGRLLRCILRG
jgi:hypothetical protein